MDIPGYRVERLIGSGGMASAYLAVQVSLERKVVLKVLDTSESSSEKVVERFINEGRIIASLTHPNIVTVYDVGIAGDAVYLSMEYVEGGDLKSRLAKGPMPPEAAEQLLRSLAAGLAVAHENGVVHRDIKPGNILFRRDGTPLISDFGIAKRLSPDHDLTATGMFLGSPNYMSPEQAEDSGVDGRADIYSLGVIFHEILTGRKPFQSDSVVELLLMHKQAPLPRLPESLARYQGLLDLMLAKRRQDRFRDCHSLLHFIDVLNDTQPDEPEPEPEPPPRHAVAAMAERRGKRLPVPLLVGLIAAGSSFGLVHFLAVTQQQSEEPIRQAVTQAPPSVPGGDDAEPSAGAVDIDQVSEAMHWLARKSLEDFRLTSPPRDNAYYYYSRLLELEPDDAKARQGLREVADRFAMLAEREIAAGNNEQARAYIAIGLQLAPDNPTLAKLNALALPSRHGFLDALGSLFQ